MARRLLKVIVAGGRTFSDYPLLVAKMDLFLSDQDGVEVVSGHARGADALGERYAKEKGHLLTIMPAEWDKGRGAGYARNIRMAEYADALVAFWDGKSRGTKHMIANMKERGKPVRIVKY